MAEEELAMAWAWLHDWDLLDDPNGKELSLDWALQVLGAFQVPVWGHNW